MPTTHHCPGAKIWIGKISPGGCERKSTGNKYCKKHQTMCEKHKTTVHLLNEPCPKCKEAIDAEERRQKKEEAQRKKAAKGDAMNAFLNPPKDRKKP